MFLNCHMVSASFIGKSHQLYHFNVLYCHSHPFSNLLKKGALRQIAEVGSSRNYLYLQEGLQLQHIALFWANRVLKLSGFGLKEPVDGVDVPNLFGVFGTKLQDVMDSAINWVSKFVFKQLQWNLWWKSN